MGLIATMAALVGALLIAWAKSSHDMQSTEVTEMSSDFILLDRTLARYGPETKDVRSLIPMTIANVLDQTWLGRAPMAVEWTSSYPAAASEAPFGFISKSATRIE